MDIKKKGLLDFRTMKQQSEKVTWLTAYDYPTARFEEQAGIDMILVGDSMGNTVYGYASGTLPVTMDMCIVHCQAVRRGAPNTFIMGDMPFGSYQTTPADAVSNAVRFFKEAEVDAVKLEGGRRVVPMIRAIVDAGMVLCGHIGLTPQSTGQFGGYKAQGRTAESAIEVIKDGPACHTGKDSCFYETVYENADAEKKAFSLEALYGLLCGRKEKLPEGSYTTYLFQKGREKILKKVGEESTEVIIGAMKGDKKETVSEIADLCYHTLVLMAEMGITPSDIAAELASRSIVDHKVKQGG